MKNRKVLITGVAGLIGSHLLDSLLEIGCTVTGIDDFSFGSVDNIKHHFGNKNFRFLECDIREFDRMLKFVGKIDVILHMAAVKKIWEAHQLLPTMTVIGRGTENVLNLAAMRNNAKVVLASASSIYGRSRNLPCKEDGESVLGPSSVKRWGYTVAKLYTEHLAFAYYKDLNVPIVILRYCGCYSSRSNFSWSGGHIPLFIDAVLNDRPIIIHGDGLQMRPILYVSSAVQGTLSAMENEKAVGEAFNLGSEEEISVLDAAKLIHKIAYTGKKLKLEFVKMKQVFGDYKEVMEKEMNMEKAKRILGFKQEVSLEEGLRIVIKERKRIHV